MSEEPVRTPRRLGVYICHCGGNISDYVDVDRVRDAMGEDDEVVVARTTMFACADATAHEMIEDIRREGLDGLVVASCSPKLHQVTFKGVATRAGLNPYAYTQVNVREQASWAHTDDPEGATRKALGLLRAGVATTKLSRPLQPLIVQTTPRTLVVGGGIAGMRAALGLADIGITVTLVEREELLGGQVGGRGAMFPHGDQGRELIGHLAEQIRQRESITVFTGAELTGKSGSFGNYQVTLTVRSGGRDEQIGVEVGAIIIATGFDDYVPTDGEFGYGAAGVLTLPEFTALVDQATGTLQYRGRTVRSIAYVYCVGSRQPGGNEYCARYCCSAAVHVATQVSALDPTCRQYHLHRDVRTTGRAELLYEAARTSGSVFVKVPDDQAPTVIAGADGRHTVEAIDLLTNGARIAIPADLVVLVTGMVARENPALTDLLKLPVGDDGFYNEIHPKLRPVETIVDGVLIAGSCQGPRSSAESVASALAAVAQGAALLKKGYTELDPLVAEVTASRCTGCEDCLTTCPYVAISSISCEGRDIVQIDPATCKGCGGCVPVCPQDAIDLLGYSDEQMRAAINGLAGPTCHTEVLA